MAIRKPNPRLVKIHRSYTIEEAADLLGVHSNSVRNWIKDGLPVIDDERPFLIRGPELAAYLTKKRLRDKQTCGPGQLYCFRCRAPRAVSHGRVNFQQSSPTRGLLIAECAVCGTRMYQQTTIAKLQAEKVNFQIFVEEAAPRIAMRDSPIVDCDQS